MGYKDRKYECEVCEDMRWTWLGTGSQTHCFNCPACVGLVRKDIGSYYEKSAREECRIAGVKPRWLRATKEVGR